jgi:hypothetical protein
MLIGSGTKSANLYTSDKAIFSVSNLLFFNPEVTLLDTNGRGYIDSATETLTAPLLLL